MGGGAQGAALFRCQFDHVVSDSSAMTQKTRRQKKSNAWMTRARQRPLRAAGQKEGWRSRAVFKLMEIDEKDQLLKPGMTVVNLARRPGSWCQYAASRIQPGGS